MNVLVPSAMVQGPTDRFRKADVEVRPGSLTIRPRGRGATELVVEGEASERGATSWALIDGEGGEWVVTKSGCGCAGQIIALD